MKGLDDTLRYGYRYVPQAGEPAVKAVRELIHAAVKLAVEEVSAGRSVDLGSIEVFETRDPMGDVYEVGWTFSTSKVIES